MVIAASLSQVQNLLQHESLQNKPQLLETFDRALTGCRVVYGCLEEEVRDLVIKAENDDLKFKDRAKFLWKEDTFKELLTQIRGQQSALTLLIQGLQMESIADIRQLVRENSATLEQVVKRSQTLRRSHPRIRVPESMFSHESGAYRNEAEDAADAESIIKSTDFSFDDEVIKSKAYRRAMALYTSNTATIETPQNAHSGCEVEKDEPPAYESTKPSCKDYEKKSQGIVSTATQQPEMDQELKSILETTPNVDREEPSTSTEKNDRPYINRNTSTAPYLTVGRSESSSKPAERVLGSTSKAPLRSYSAGYQESRFDDAPPLPPRRPSGSQLRQDDSTVGSPDTYFTSSSDSLGFSESPSTLSRASTAPSPVTSYEPSQASSNMSKRPLRKPLPLRHQVSYDVLGSIPYPPSLLHSPVSASPLYNVEMHNIWLSLIDVEQKFVERMTKLRKMFYDNVLRNWPLLDKHLDAILVGEQLANLNKVLLLQTMEHHISDSAGATIDPLIFETYMKESHRLYREYCQRMPHAISSLRTTQMQDQKFTPFVNTVGLSLTWFGKTWEDYLKLPLSHIDLYINSLQSLIDIVNSLDESVGFREAVRLRRALEAVKWLKTLCSTLIEDAQNREDVQILEKRVHTVDADYFSQLRLLDSARRIRYQGGMAIKLKSQGPWQSVHAVLLDNFLVWGKVKLLKKSKADKIMVLDAPIPVDALEIAPPCEQHQFQKATMFDEIARGSVVYIITVKNKDSDDKAHMLGALGVNEHKLWLEHLNAATTRSNAMV
jgi:hypothetical protein